MTHPLSRRRVIGAGGTAAAFAVALSPQASPARAQTPPGGRTGEMITLVTPRRIFDSRLESPSIGGGKLSAGNTVAVTVSAGTLGGATRPSPSSTAPSPTPKEAATSRSPPPNLSGELPPPQTSNINWSTNGQTLANLVLTAVGGENGITVACGGNGRTHFIIDLQGYVPAP